MKRLLCLFGIHNKNQATHFDIKKCKPVVSEFCSLCMKRNDITEKPELWLPITDHAVRDMYKNIEILKKMSIDRKEDIQVTA
jgi:hypothetical protein